MYRVLVVDDEAKIREVIREYAEFEGYEVTEAANGMEAVQVCRQQDFDAIVMDIMMPRLDGFSTCKEIRKFKQIPVLMLSARGEEYDKLFGFEMGIDDYVVKPFSPKELMARLNVIITRNKKVTDDRKAGDVVSFENLTIDFPGRNVYVGGKKAELTMKECDLLFFLAKNPNIVFSREKLLSEVWGYDYYGDDRTVDSHVKMLRNSLGECRKFIVTSRGVGYKFETEV